MYANLALSGGAHLCIPFIGFLKSVRHLVEDTRCVSGISGGALVAATWVLEIPETNVLRVLSKHMVRGIMKDVDVTCLLDKMGLVDVEETIGGLCKEMISEGISRWNVIKKGWGPCPDDVCGGTLTMQQLAKMTGRNLAIGVCDVNKGFKEVYITADTHPDVEVWRALCASCAVPFAFTPVRIGDSLFCDACVRDNNPVRGIPGSNDDETCVMVDTLVVEVEVLSGACIMPNKCPQNILEYGKGVLSAMIDRISYSDPHPRARVVRITRWTEDKLDPLVLGTDAPSIMHAYYHGVRCGKEFLELVNKETASRT